MPEPLLGLRIHCVHTALAIKNLYANVRENYDLVVIGTKVKAANFAWGNHRRLPGGGDV